MNLISKGSILSLVVITVFVALPFISCKDKTGPAEAIITVVDSSGNRIRQAKVILSQDSVVNPTNGVQASVYEVGYTDASGSVAFSFKLEAVLNVDASKGTRSGTDFIRLEQNETVSKSVIID